MDWGEDDGVLLNSVIYAVSVPSGRKTVVVVSSGLFALSVIADVCIADSAGDVSLQPSSAARQQGPRLREVRLLTEAQRGAHAQGVAASEMCCPGRHAVNWTLRRKSHLSLFT